MESKEQIARLWDKISARIAADGGVLHRSSFEQEVAEWLRPAPTSGRQLIADHEERLRQARLTHLFNKPLRTWEEIWKNQT